MQEEAPSRPGWGAFRHLPGSKKVELPIRQLNPTYAPMRDAEQKGYTLGTLQKLGALCEEPDIKATYMSQLERMGDWTCRDLSGKVLQEADGRPGTVTQPQIVWPRGKDYE
eukprot:COSAG02_NODE_44967_length_361_cov_0.980916_1_plen_110_part_10